MSNNNHRNVSEQQQLASTAEEKPRRLRDKGAKQRATEKFTRSANAKFMQQAREAAQKRLGVFNQDAAELEASIKSLAITVQPRAIPLPVATRRRRKSASPANHKPSSD